VRVSVVILPIYRWRRASRVWQRAEQLGLHAAYTYDHLSWRDFRDGPWFGAVPTLTAAAVATERIALGTMVTSPNFRHPVTLAKDLMTIDDVSRGRLRVGIGAGGSGYDATTLGQPAWSARERADRFAEFVPLLDRLLRQDATTEQGRFYSAEEARMLPGCVQQPRVPFLIAATGPRGMRLAARYGHGWVTTGPGAGYRTVSGDPPTAAEARQAVADQIERLGAAGTEADAGVKVDELERVLLTGFLPEDPLASVDAFVDLAGRYGEVGITELVVHWPVPNSMFAADQTLFERIVTDALPQLRGF
jgi:alkanesulfonate monooxygenase SsuD/methylene tetrahydromethanopterin reductase-like flavin-dependent oxidoreductase (luciferase family)